MSVKSFVMPSDMSDLCRVCLQLPEESQYLDLTTIYDEDDNLTYGECFTICTQIDLSADEDVPHHLCKPCGLELQMSYDFYKKIEESNRVIEQYKNQAKLQESTSEQTKTFNLEDEEDELTDEEEQLPEPAELTEDECVIKEEDVQDFIATADVVDETEEIDVDMCETEANTHQQLNLNKNNSSLETTNAENIKIHVQDQVEVDYQNFEILEEEEKIKKLVTNINIKRECLNEDEHIKFQDEVDATTEAHPQYTPGQTLVNQDIINTNVEASSEYDNCREDEILNILEAKQVKIEKEIFIENNVTTNSTLFERKYYPSTTSAHFSDVVKKLFSCEICGHGLKSKNSLYKHRARNHKNEKHLRQNLSSVNCPLCSKSFKTTVLLRKHIEAKHTYKSFVCEQCGHKLPTRNALCQHRKRKHRDIKKIQQKVNKFKCNKCSEFFMTAKKLTLHTETTHRITAEKSCFQCDVCGHQLRTKNSLYKHCMRKHRNKNKK